VCCRQAPAHIGDSTPAFLVPWLNT
jgi:hypothetical protein